MKYLLSVVRQYVNTTDDREIIDLLSSRPIQYSSFHDLRANGWSLQRHSIPARRGLCSFVDKSITIDVDLRGLAEHMVLAHEIVHAHLGWPSYDGVLCPSLFKPFRYSIVEILGRAIVATPNLARGMLVQAPYLNLNKKFPELDSPNQELLPPPVEGDPILTSHYLNDLLDAP